MFFPHFVVTFGFASQFEFRLEIGLSLFSSTSEPIDTRNSKGTSFFDGFLDTEEKLESSVRRAETDKRQKMFVFVNEKSSDLVFFR